MAVESTQVGEQPPAPSFQMLAADTLGQIKVMQAPSEKLSEVKQISQWGEPNRADSIQCMTVTCTEDSQHAAESALVAVARAGGQCEVRLVASGEPVGQIEATTRGREQANDSSISGMHFLRAPPGLPMRQPTLLTCTSSGLIRIHQCPDPSVADGGLAWEEIASWQGPDNVLATAVDEAGQRLAFGCEGSELSIWGIQSRQRSYLAKGAKPNRVGLTEKAWTTAVAFLPGCSGTKLVVGTGQHRLRVYDTAQRRPTLAVEFGEAKVTALAPESDGQRCWAADSQGQIACLELKLGKLQGVIRGCAGSVRCLAIHPSLPILASACLDRFLRLHDLSSRKLLAKVFLKQHLTAVAFCPSPPQPSVHDANLEMQAEEEREVVGAEAKQEARKRRMELTSEQQGNIRKKKKKQKQRVIVAEYNINSMSCPLQGSTTRNHQP